MARPPRNPRTPTVRPGEKPFLQGHLKPGGAKPGGAPAGDAPGESKPATDAAPAEQPSGDASSDAVSGKSTKSPADVATRPHLEGSEQGPA